MLLIQSYSDNADLLHSTHQSSVESLYQSTPFSITHCTHNSSMFEETDVPNVLFSISVTKECSLLYKRVMNYKMVMNDYSSNNLALYFLLSCGLKSGTVFA